MLNAEEKTKYETELQQLRLDLKKWETEWARDHDGAKPSRADIKHHREIAEKYTAYNRVRDVLSGKVSPSKATKKDTNGTRRDAKKDDSEARRKRKTAATDAPVETPTKRLRPVETPQKTGIAAVAAADAATPSISRRLFSPAVPTSIGPTPQRDGRVLGLFDFLAEEAGEAERRKSMAATPSKRKEVSQQPGKTGSTPAALPSQSSPFAFPVATPRKQTLGRYEGDDEDDAENGYRRLGRTPMSSAKRNLLDRFTAGTTSFSTSVTATTDSYMIMSPLRARDANIQQGGGGGGGGGQQEQHQQQLSALPQFTTPSFLRRAPVQLAVDENGEFLSPPGRLRLPRKPLVRGLSSVLASLRKLEDDRLDEELDVLRELEAEEGNGPPAPKAKQQQQQQQQQKPEEVIQTKDSQRLLGGFDDEGLYDSEPEAQTNHDGQPLRVFKKKGQKRTTRLVYMRPTRTRRPATNSAIKRDGSDFDEEEEEEIVPETQLGSRVASDDGGSDGEWSDGEAEAQRSAKENKKKKTKANEKKSSKTSAAAHAKMAKAAEAAEDGTGSKAGPVIKRAARKVNELAHANFKRLKLRNSGSKGGPGFNSRFRRRR